MFIHSVDGYLHRSLHMCSNGFLQRGKLIFESGCLEASGSDGPKSGDILTGRSLSEEHESKSFAFVLQ